MNRYEKAARLALAKRLRSMVADPDEFEGLNTDEEKLIASDYFVGETIKLADRLTRAI